MTYYACTSLRYRDCGGGVGNSLEFGWKGDKGGRNYMGGIRHRSYYHCEFVCLWGGGARERKIGIEGNYTSRSSKRKNERERRRGVVGLEESGKGKKKNKFRYFIVIDVKRVRFFFIFFFIFKCLEHTQPPLRRLRTKISRRANGKNVVFFSVFAYCIYNNTAPQMVSQCY